MDLTILADDLRRITVGLTNADEAVGSGVIWAPGWIVTNAHVVPRPRVAVRLADGRRSEGLVVARDSKADLAVLRVPDFGVPAAISAEPGVLRVGSLIIAIGHPFGMRG